jgi:hypothetical protein
MLWVTCVLDTVYQRVADGQSVGEVKRYIINLPRDLENYYFELVYSRIHSTYRTGKVSECAMALKIVTCALDRYRPEESRFELIWALHISTITGAGVAHDPEFFARPLPSETSHPLNQKIFQSVSAFVNSRCKDLMVTTMRGEQGYLSYQHRVIHDFLFSDRMRLSLNAAVPEHFRQPQFAFHLGLLSVRQQYERARCRKSPGDMLYDGVSTESTSILHDHLIAHLSGLQGPLDQRAAQTCDEITTDMVRPSVCADIDKGQFVLLLLTLQLARIQRFTCEERRTARENASSTLLAGQRSLGNSSIGLEK